MPNKNQVFKFAKKKNQTSFKSKPKPVYTPTYVPQRPQVQSTGQWDYCLNRDLYDKMHAEGHMVPVSIYAAMMNANRQRAELEALLSRSSAKSKKVVKNPPKVDLIDTCNGGNQPDQGLNLTE